MEGSKIADQGVHKGDRASIEAWKCAFFEIDRPADDVTDQQND